MGSDLKIEIRLDMRQLKADEETLNHVGFRAGAEIGRISGFAIRKVWNSVAF